LLYGLFRRKFHNTLSKGISDWQEAETGLIYTQDVSLISRSFPVHEWVDKTPDLYTLDGDVVKIIEVSISLNPEFMLRKKQAKYEPTVESAREIGISVIMDYFIWNGDQEMVSHLKNCNLLRELWEMDLELIQLGFKDEEVDEIEMTMPENYVKSFFRKRGLEDPTWNLDEMSDDEYLDRMSVELDKHLMSSEPETLHRYPKLESADGERDLFDLKFQRASFSLPSNIEKPKKVLQLGCPMNLVRELDFDEVARIPRFENGFGSHFSGLMRGMYNVQITPLEKETMMMEGPGMKIAKRYEGKGQTSTNSPWFIG